ncbi:MAG: hypothetical protein M1833_000029 [Piccolia ochrophora]|nr:MAG: hypothetical protein M1833_000029 [Piccolia ochrophora]
MAEPLSITASIIALLQLTSKVVKYLNNASSASKDSSRILIELGSVNGYLLILEDLVGRADGGETSLCTVRSLGVPYGPLAQFKSTLERLAKHLEPVFGIKKAGKVLRWPFKKDEVTDMIFALERQKAFFILAMENDQMQLSMASLN